MGQMDIFLIQLLKIGLQTLLRVLQSNWIGDTISEITLMSTQIGRKTLQFSI